MMGWRKQLIGTRSSSCRESRAIVLKHAVRVTLNGIGAEPSVRCAQYHLSRRPAGERGRVQPARFTDGMHCMRRGSHPPCPPFARGGQSTTSFLGGGGGGESRRRLVFFPPLRRGDTGGCSSSASAFPPGSASRRLKTALTQSASDEANFSLPFAEEASLLETEGVTLTAAHNKSVRGCERYLPASGAPK